MGDYGDRRVSASPSQESIASAWLGDGRRVVAATLIDRIGSAPLDPGAQMLVDDGGPIEGSVTGGCVEGALVEEAQQLLAGGTAKVVTYGVSDEEAAGVGLMCGGTVRVFVHELAEDAPEQLERGAAAVAAGRPAAIATLLDGDHAGAKLAVLEEGVAGSLGVTELLDYSVARDARGLLDEGLSRIRRYGEGGEVMGSDLAVYIQSFAAPPEMVIFGAIDFSAEMAKVASEIGYGVTICEAREPFLSSPRFSSHADVVVD